MKTVMISLFAVLFWPVMALAGIQESKIGCGYYIPCGPNRCHDNTQTFDIHTMMYTNPDSYDIATCACRYPYQNKYWFHTGGVNLAGWSECAIIINRVAAPDIENY